MLQPRFSQRGRQFVQRLMIVLAITALIALPLFAQTTARIEGTVKDQSGAVVPNAKVTATETKTGQEKQTTTNENGLYVFPSVAPGNYTVSAEAAGFTKVITKNIEVSAGGFISQNLALKVGASGEVVTVEANAVTVQTTDSQISRVLTMKEIDTLPALGRTPITLAVYQPGIQLNPGDVSFSRINGQRSGSNNSRLDGIDVNDSVVPRLGLSMTANNTDSVGEFRIITEGAKAEYGRNAGGTVDLITRPGTNRFHGNAFDYLRNTVLNANEFFNKQTGGQRPKFIQNQFGGSFGGPIMKDRSFFFGNYQGRRTKQETVRNRTVLTPQAKAGLFRWNSTVGPTAGTVQSFDIVANDPRGLGIDPTVATNLAMLPDPNNFDLGDGLNTAGFRFNNPTDSFEDQFTIRGDHNITRNMKAFIRWSWQRNSSIDALNSADATFPGQVHGRQGGHRWGYATGLDWSISSTWANEFRFGHQSATAAFLRDARPKGPAFISNLFTDPINTAFAQGRVSPVDVISDNVSKVWGNHTFRFGGSMNITKQQGYNDAGAYPNVNFSVADAPVTVAAPITASTAATSGFRTTYQSLYNDLLGRIGRVTSTFYSLDLATFQPLGTSRVRDHRLNDSGYYFQDDWKVLPNLTLNLGVRYELFKSPVEANGIQATVANSDQINGVNQIQNLTVQQGDAWYKTDYNNFAPRFGFAWDVKGDGKTAVRGNYGIFFDRQIGATVSAADGGTPGFTQSGLTLPNGAGGDYRVRDGLPAVIPALPAAPSLTVAVGARSQSLTIFNPNLRTGYVQQFSLNVQREVMRNTVVEVGYVAARGVKLFMQQDLNQIRFKDDFLPAFKQLQAFQTSPASGTPTNTLTALFPAAFCTAAQYTANPTLPANNAASCAIIRLGASNFSLGNVATAARTLEQSFATTRYPTIGLPQTYLRNYPQFDFVAVGGNGGRNYYDSLQVSFRRNTGALRLVGNYTYSKSIDNISVDANGFTVPIDNYDLSMNRGRGDFDHRHSFNGSVIYTLPFGQGQRWAHNAPRWLDTIIGGWEVGSLFQLQDGTVYSISSQRSTKPNTQALTTRANFAGSPNSIGTIDKRSDGKVFYYTAADLAMFSFPLAGEIGNSGRNAFRGPGFFNVDSSLVKRFKITESHAVTFRAEAYNLLNKANFNNPATNLNTPATFGQISGTTGARILQLALRYDF